MMDSNAGPCVFLVDDDSSVRKALKRVLVAKGFNVAVFSSAADFLTSYDPNIEGCLVLDINMPDMDGIELQNFLVDHDSILPIIFLTGHGDIPMSVSAMRHGAADFLTKPADTDLLVTAISRAFDKSRLDHQALLERLAIKRRLALLTVRERQVLEHLIGGRLNKQVAADLGTVEKTIKVHRSRIMEKMQVRSLVELARLCEQVGIKPAR